MTECIDHGRRGNVKGYHGTTRRVHGVLVKGHAHRMVYCKHNNVTWASIVGLVVRHKCDNPRCINPEHLEIGTVGDNNRDRHERGRNAVGMSNGNCKWSDEQVAQIRRLGHLTIREISKLTGVPKSTVQGILAGDSRV